MLIFYSYFIHFMLIFILYSAIFDKNKHVFYLFTFKYISFGEYVNGFLHFFPVFLQFLCIEYKCEID